MQRKNEGQTIKPWTASTQDTLSPVLRDHIFDDVKVIQKTLLRELENEVIAKTKAFDKLAEEKRKIEEELRQVDSQVGSPKKNPAKLSKKSPPNFDGFVLNTPKEFDTYLLNELKTANDLEKFFSIIELIGGYNQSVKPNENKIHDDLQPDFASILNKYKSRLVFLQRLNQYQSFFVKTANQIRQDLVRFYSENDRDVPAYLTIEFQNKTDVSHFLRIFQQSTNEVLPGELAKQILQLEHNSLLLPMIEKALRLQDQISQHQADHSRDPLILTLTKLSLHSEAELEEFIRDIKSHLHDKKYKDIFDDEFRITFNELNEDHILYKIDRDFLYELNNFQSDFISAHKKYNKSTITYPLDEFEKPVSGAKSPLHLINRIAERLKRLISEQYQQLINSTVEIKSVREAYDALDGLRQRAKILEEKALISFAEQLRKTFLLQSVSKETAKLFTQKPLENLNQFKQVLQKPITNLAEVEVFIKWCEEWSLDPKIKQQLDPYLALNSAYTSYLENIEAANTQAFILYRNLLARAEESSILEWRAKESTVEIREERRKASQYEHYQLKHINSSRDYFLDSDFHKEVAEVNSRINKNPEAEILFLHEKLNELHKQEILALIKKEMHGFKNYDINNLTKYFVIKSFLKNLSSQTAVKNELMYEEKRALYLWHLYSHDHDSDMAKDAFHEDLFAEELVTVFNSALSKLKADRMNDFNVEELAKEVQSKIELKNKDNPALNRDSATAENKNDKNYNEKEYRPRLAVHDAKDNFKKHLNALLQKLSVIDEICNHEDPDYTHVKNFLPYRDQLSFTFPNESQIAEQDWRDFYELVEFTQNALAVELAPESALVPLSASSSNDSHSVTDSASVVAASEKLKSPGFDAVSHDSLIDNDSESSSRNSSQRSLLSDYRGELPEKKEKVESTDTTALSWKDALVCVAAGIILSAAVVTLVTITYGGALPLILGLGVAATSWATTSTVAATAVGFGIVGLALTTPMTAISLGIAKLSKVFGADKKSATKHAPAQKKSDEYAPIPTEVVGQNGSYKTLNKGGLPPSSPEIPKKESNKEGKPEETVSETSGTSPKIEDQSEQTSSGPGKKY